MTKKQVGVGVIGCGNISTVYFTNMTQHFKNLNVISCADIVEAKAVEAKEKYGLQKAYSVEEMLEDKDIDIIVNLTIPSQHYKINMQALRAGKHVYSEKPLALSLDEANEIYDFAIKNGLFAASAPDTFLGTGLQTCRKLIDDGVIGEVVGFTANLIGHGVDLWHPNPLFFYQKGGGPMLDMGPYYITALVSLIGPIKHLSCFARATFPKRELQGKMETVEVPTNYTGIVEFCNGAIGNVNMSFDIWKSTLPCLEIHGTEGSMYVPDPNMFGGPVKVFRSAGLVERIKTTCNTPIERLMTLVTKSDEYLTEEQLQFPAEPTERSNMRGMGVSDMAQAILKGRSPRVNCELSRHVVEALTAFEISQITHSIYKMKTTCERPKPLPTGLALWQLD